MGDVRPIRSESAPSKGLTGIQKRTQRSATRDTPEGGYSETDMIIVNNFLNTLAEIALAVASRQGTTKAHDQD